MPTPSYADIQNYTATLRDLHAMTKAYHDERSRHQETERRNQQLWEELQDACRHEVALKEKLATAVAALRAILADPVYRRCDIAARCLEELAQIKGA